VVLVVLVVVVVLVVLVVVVVVVVGGGDFWDGQTAEQREPSVRPRLGRLDPKHYRRRCRRRARAVPRSSVRARPPLAAKQMGSTSHPLPRRP
jgi:hypothetical protein